MRVWRVACVCVLVFSFQYPKLKKFPVTIENERSAFITEPNICIQTAYTYVDYDIIGDENCLYLNVLTSKNEKHQKSILGKNINHQEPDVDSLMPVLVWIHGGSFISGWGDKDFDAPDHFIQKVTVSLFLLRFLVSIW